MGLVSSRVVKEMSYRQTATLHARGHVDGVAKQAIYALMQRLVPTLTSPTITTHIAAFLAHHAGHHRPRVHADAQLQLRLRHVGNLKGGGRRQQVQGQGGNLVGVLLAVGPRHARHHHVGVANRLYLVAAGAWKVGPGIFFPPFFTYTSNSSRTSSKTEYRLSSMATTCMGVLWLHRFVKPTISTREEGREC